MSERGLLQIVDRLSYSYLPEAPAPRNAPTVRRTTEPALVDNPLVSGVRHLVSVVPLPLFFALGAVFGMLLAIGVAGAVGKKSASRPVAQAALHHAAASVESARVLVVVGPQAVAQRDAAGSDDERTASEQAPSSHARTVASNRRAHRTSGPSSLPSNLLNAGLAL